MKTPRNRWITQQGSPLNLGNSVSYVWLESKLDYNGQEDWRVGIKVNGKTVYTKFETEEDAQVIFWRLCK